MSEFDELEQLFAAGGSEAALARLADYHQAQGQFHELFDARLVQARLRLGLPLTASGGPEDAPEPLRAVLHEAYGEACGEVGALLLAARRWREAWLYLRPTGQRDLIAAALAQIEPTADNFDELVELALYQDIAPQLGFRWVLEQCGTCDAITTFENTMPGKTRSLQQAAAGMLVRQMHAELLANVRAEITRRDGAAPPEAALGDLIRRRDWLFEDCGCHVDVSHLGAVVRFARLVEDVDVLPLAIEFTDYGQRLDSRLQFPGDEPFVENFLAHGLLFAAQLGQRVDEAIDYFRRRAEAAQGMDETVAAADVYIALLARLGRHAEAMDASAKLLPANSLGASSAPSLLELARLSGRYDRLKDISRQRGDLLGFVTALVAGVDPSG